MTPASTPVRSSVARLRGLTEGLSDEDLAEPAYPAGWSIADVLSHIGSAAVITQHRLVEALAGRDVPADFAPGIRETWNIKSPPAQRDDALVADAALLSRLDAVSPDERDRFTFTMGPLTFGSTTSSGCASTSTPSTPGTSRSSPIHGP
jgi:Mycothiol maleylpyruvate isomerase N-terminal domain